MAAEVRRCAKYAFAKIRTLRFRLPAYFCPVNEEADEESPLCRDSLTDRTQESRFTVKCLTDSASFPTPLSILAYNRNYSTYINYSTKARVLPDMSIYSDV